MAVTGIHIKYGDSKTISFEVDKELLCYDGNAFATEPFMIQNVPWVVEGSLKNVDDRLTLGIYAKCNSENKSPLWSCTANVQFKLCSLNAEARCCSCEKKFSIRNGVSGIPSFIIWNNNELRGFVNADGKLAFEVCVKVKTSVGLRSTELFEFTENDDTADLILFVEDKELYVSKQYLALHSPVFHAMFYGESKERDLDEITLTNVPYEDFRYFLEVLYPSNRSIYVDSVDYLLHLAALYRVDSVLAKCELFLMSDPAGISLMQKLIYAENYGFAQLQNHCLKQLATIDDIKKLRASADFSQVGDATEAALFQRMCNLS